MKTWLKNNSLYLVGNLLIWGVPLTLLVIMAIDSKSQQTQISMWVLIGFVVYFLIYLIKIKKVLNDTVKRQLDKDNFIHWWVYLIRMFSAICPFVCALLVLEKVKEAVMNGSSEIAMFIYITLASFVIGYFCLMKNSFEKQKLLTIEKL